LAKLELFRAVYADSLLQTDSILESFADTFAISDLGELDKADRELGPDLGSTSITKAIVGKAWC
jgi:hypothetical protein